MTVAAVDAAVVVGTAAGLPKINAEAPAVALFAPVAVVVVCAAAAPNRLPPMLLGAPNIGALVDADRAGAAAAATDEPKAKPVLCGAAAVDAADPNTNEAAGAGLALTPNAEAVLLVLVVAGVANAAVVVAEPTELPDPKVLAPNSGGGAAAAAAGAVGFAAAVRPNEKPPLVAGAAGAASVLAGVAGFRPPNDDSPVDGEPKANSGFLAAGAAVASATVAIVLLVVLLLPKENPAAGLMP